MGAATPGVRQLQRRRRLHLHVLGHQQVLTSCGSAYNKYDSRNSAQTSASTRTTSSASRTATSPAIPTPRESRASTSPAIARHRLAGLHELGPHRQHGPTHQQPLLDHGQHSLKIGGDCGSSASTLTNPQTQPRGRFTFGPPTRATPARPGTGDAFASFLLGYPNQIAARLRRHLSARCRRTSSACSCRTTSASAQADASTSGCAGTCMTPPVERTTGSRTSASQDGLIHARHRRQPRAADKQLYDDFGAAAGARLHARRGKDGVPRGLRDQLLRDNFGANGGTQRTQLSVLPGNDLLQSPTQFTPFRSLSDGLPAFTSVPLAPTLAPPPGFAVFYIPRATSTRTRRRCGTSASSGSCRWSTMVDVSYVGTRGTNIFRSRNINVPLPGAGRARSAAAVLQRRAEHRRPSTSATATASPGTTRCR